MNVNSQFVSAIFYRQTDQQENIDFYLYQDQTSGELQHLHVNLLSEDLDPSLNVALARGLYQKMYSFEVDNQEDYIKLLSLDDHFSKFSAILKQINDCDTLIDGQDFKIYFLNYSEFFEEKLPLHKTDLNSEKIRSQTKQFFQDHNIVEYAKQNLNSQKTLFCILNPDDHRLWVNLLEGLFQGPLQGENQKWISFDLTEMKPFNEELFKKIKGFVITGGHSHAYDTSLPYIPYSYEIFNKIIYPEQDNEQKLVGICWGHQAVAHGCGGKSSKLPNNNCYHFREEIKYHDVDVNDQLNLSKILPQPFYSIKSHGDYVYELPREAKLICSSEKVEIEGMSIRNRALTFQFHTEFNRMLLMKVMDECKEFPGIQEIAQKAIQSFSQETYISNKYLNAQLKKFLVS
ncbi:hypothetical protein ABPG72_014362 [Tetrahymena utriculariae]